MLRHFEHEGPIIAQGHALSNLKTGGGLPSVPCGLASPVVHGYARPAASARRSTTISGLQRGSYASGRETSAQAIRQRRIRRLPPPSRRGWHSCARPMRSQPEIKFGKGSAVPLSRNIFALQRRNIPPKHPMSAPFDASAQTNLPTEKIRSARPMEQTFRSLPPNAGSGHAFTNIKPILGRRCRQQLLRAESQNALQTLCDRAAHVSVEGTRRVSVHQGSIIGYRVPLFREDHP